MSFVHFGEMCWPTPDPELEWKLRYGKPTRNEIIVAASILHAYQTLVTATRKKRDYVVRELRADRTAQAGKEGERG